MAEDLDIQWQGDQVFVPPGLTHTQYTILRLSAMGKDQYEIAALIGRAVGTVKSYRNQMLKAMGVKSTKHAVALAYERGWLGRGSGESQAA